MKKFDRNEIIGKTVKDLEKLDWQEEGKAFPHKRHWLLALSVALFVFLLSGSVWWFRSYAAGLASGIAPSGTAGQSDAADVPLPDAVPPEEAAQPDPAVVPPHELEPPVTEMASTPDTSGGQQSQTSLVGDLIQHEIKAGEYLGDISMKYYGTSVHAAAIAQFNQLPVDTVLQIGQIIQVPRQAGQLQP